MSTHPQDCQAAVTESKPAAWLGQAGLYRTRLEGVQNGEQRMSPLSIDQLFQHARSHLFPEANA